MGQFLSHLGRSWEPLWGPFQQVRPKVVKTINLATPPKAIGAVNTISNSRSDPFSFDSNHVANERETYQLPVCTLPKIFDQKVTHLLRDEYRIRRVSKVTGQTLADLADKMEGVDKQGFLDEIQHYNNAVQRGIKFDPNVKDGRGTVGLEINKSNWANTLDEGPFEAYHITCGITFTFGGIRVDPKTSQVINDDLEPIQGLYAAGELVGGLFYFNYPGGTGLMSGSGFGRQAGNSAGKL